MKSHVHTLNTSKAKQKYSFGKSERFQPYRPPTDLSYLPKASIDRKSAIIGSGERSLIIDKNRAEYPHAYGIPSTLSKRGYSMIGRSDIGGPMENLRASKIIPGPSYSLPSTLDKKGASLKPRLSDLTDKYIKSVPGPGTYSVPSSLSNGQQKIMDSKYTYGGSVRIPRKKEDYQLDVRQPTYEKKQVPGPGQYDIMKYGISNPEAPPSKKQAYTKFGKQYRHSIIGKLPQQPGPGTYKIYSEFDG